MCIPAQRYARIGQVYQRIIQYLFEKIYNYSFLDENIHSLLKICSGNAELYTFYIIIIHLEVEMKYFTDKKTTKPAAPKQEEKVSVSEKYNLTGEQMKVIQALEEGKSVVVDSVIGSGKTRVLQAVCDHFPHKRILYLTYNRLLKLDAQEKIHNSNTTVQNYHGFVYKYLSRRNISVQPSKQIRAFLTYCKDVPLIYDLVLVDEYQVS